jgi:hypothetical protein
MEINSRQRSAFSCPAQFLKIKPALVRHSFHNPRQCSLVLTLRRFEYQLKADSYFRFPAWAKRVCNSPYVWVTGNCGNSLGR